MMSRTFLAIAALAFVCSLVGAPRADADAAFVVLVYHPRTEATIVCPAQFACDVALEKGETVRDGFAGNPDDLDPHVTYTGERDAKGRCADQCTPHLIFRPAVGGLHTNIIVPTSRRIYYLDLRSTRSPEARYYTFSFPRVIIARAPSTPRPVVAIVAPTPTPAPPNPTAACVPRLSHYTYHFDRGLPQDHPLHAISNYGDLTALWQPRKVCTDGRHTFVEFDPSPITPDDTPIMEELGPEGDTLDNYTYDARARRMKIDGVPTAFVLEFGSQNSPLRLVLHHELDFGTAVDPAKGGNTP